MKYDIVKLMARRKIRWKKRWVSGDSGGRLTFRSKKAGRLSDYRIYGNTVGGESVGDLVTSGQHAGEYVVPVTVEGKNLFDKNYFILSNLFGQDSGRIVADPYTISTIIPCNPNTKYTISKIVTNRFIIWGCTDYPTRNEYCNGRITSDYDSSSLTFTTGSDDNYLLIMLFYQRQPTDPTIEDVKGSLMFNYGEALPYEPYQPPVTTNLYLPEQIKKVGDEAEYIDYGEQKQHRVRVNLFEGVIVNGSFSSASGDLVTAGNRIRMNGDTLIYLVPGTYTINASGVDDVAYYSYSEADVSTYARSGSQVNWLSLPCTFEVTNAFYFLFGFRFSDNLNISPSDISNIMLNSGSEPLPYEPYIENTDLDVILPALPTIKGTNVLSVGTAVQPSRVEVKGRIKAVGQETAEAEQEAAEPEQEEPEVKEDDTDDR